MIEVSKKVDVITEQRSLDVSFKDFEWRIILTFHMEGFDNEPQGISRPYQNRKKGARIVAVKS